LYECLLSLAAFYEKNMIVASSARVLNSDVTPGLHRPAWPSEDCDVTKRKNDVNEINNKLKKEELLWKKEELLEKKEELLGKKEACKCKVGLLIVLNELKLDESNENSSLEDNELDKAVLTYFYERNVDKEVVFDRRTCEEQSFLSEM